MYMGTSGLPPCWLHPSVPLSLGTFHLLLSGMHTRVHLCLRVCARTHASQVPHPHSYRYGDYTPDTIPGKLVASVTMVSGILVLVFPVIIIGTSFQAHQVCPRLVQTDRIHGGGGGGDCWIGLWVL